MIPPFGCCYGLDEGGQGRRRHQQRKLHLLIGWRDALERQLAALNAAISTLEQQMERDATNPSP